MVSNKTQYLIKKLHNLDNRANKIKERTQTMGAYLPSFSLLLIVAEGIIDILQLVALSSVTTFLLVNGLVSYSTFFMFHPHLTKNTLSQLAFLGGVLLTTSYLNPLKNAVGMIYDFLKLQHISNIVCIVLEKTKQRILPDLPELNNVSSLELNRLVNALHAFTINTGFTVTNPNDHQAFVDHLDRTQQIDLLLILHRAGADKIDCSIEKFEDAKARALGAPGRNSLLWLSARALHQASDRTLSAEGMERARELVNESRRFVIPLLR